MIIYQYTIEKLYDEILFKYIEQIIISEIKYENRKDARWIIKYKQYQIFLKIKK